MKIKTNKQILHLLRLAEAALANPLKHPEIMEKLSGYGYDEARIKEGDQLRLLAEELTSKQREEYVNLNSAQVNVNKTHEQIKAKYYKHLQIARIVFRDDDANLAVLKAKGTRKYALGSWIKQVKVFYTNALKSESIMEKLDIMRLDRDQLQEGLNMLEKLEDAVALKEQRKGNAMEATKVRDKAFKELRVWLDDLKTVVYMIYGKGKGPKILGFETQDIQNAVPEE